MAVKAFEQIAQKMESADKAKKAAAKAEKERKKQEAAQAAKQKAEEEKYGEIWAFADEKKKQYPDMANEMFQKLRNCPTKAEAKRLWKNHLVASASEVDLGPRWMTPV